MRVHQHQGRRGDRVPDPRTWREAAAAGEATPTADKDAAIQLLGDFQAKFSDLFSVTPGSAVPDHLQDVQKWLTEQMKQDSRPDQDVSHLEGLDRSQRIPRLFKPVGDRGGPVLDDGECPPDGLVLRNLRSGRRRRPP